MMSDTGPAIISSAHGQLRQLLVAYATDRMNQVVEELGKTLPSYTQIFIWTPSVQRQLTLTQFLRSHNISFERYQPGLNSGARCMILSPSSSNVFIESSSWVQDPFLILAEQKTGHRLFLCPPPCAGTGRNQDLPNHLIDTGFPALTQKVPWFHFQGGNCLTGDDFMLIGRYDFQQTMAFLKVKDPSAKALSFIDLEKYTRKKIGSTLGLNRIIPVGTAHFISPGPCLPNSPDVYRALNRNLKSPEFSRTQPFPHLDLYLSLAGRDETKTRYRLVMAEVIPITGTTDDKVRAKDLNRHLNSIAKTLEEEDGFQVLRNPVPLLPGHHFAYYNNCLLEIRDPAQKTVWLPQFARKNPQLEEWDQKNATIWQILGFDIIPLNNLYPFTLKRGAIHCLTKYLQRK